MAKFTNRVKTLGDQVRLYKANAVDPWRESRLVSISTLAPMK
jgi:hypothetical protein